MAALDTARKLQSLHCNASPHCSAVQALAGNATARARVALCYGYYNNHQSQSLKQQCQRAYSPSVTHSSNGFLISITFKYQPIMTNRVVTLVGVDTAKTNVTLKPGKTTLGRNFKELNCPDKKVSREHALIEVDDDGEVWLTANHVNPCYIHKDDSTTGTHLKKGDKHHLADGEKFSLLPNTYIYKVVLKNSSQAITSSSDTNDSKKKATNEDEEDSEEPEEEPEPAPAKGKKEDSKTKSRASTSGSKKSKRDDDDEEFDDDDEDYEQSDDDESEEEESEASEESDEEEMSDSDESDYTDSPKKKKGSAKKPAAKGRGGGGGGARNRPARKAVKKPLIINDEDDDEDDEDFDASSGSDWEEQAKGKSRGKKKRVASSDDSDDDWGKPKKRKSGGRNLRGRA